MSSNSRGKKFEDIIKKAIQQVPNTACIRLYDTTNGFIGVNNPADFIGYHYPNMYCLECKSIEGNTLNFKSDIRPNQWEGLLELSKCKHLVAGFLVWFVDHDLTVFVSIEEMQKLKDDGQKSLNVNKLPKHFVIDSTKKRTFFEYDFTRFFEEIGEK